MVPADTWLTYIVTVEQLCELLLSYTSIDMITIFMVTWQVAGEDSLANGFILSLLDTEDTEAQEFLQKWVIMFEFPCHTVHAFVTSHEMVELVSIAVIERTALCYYWYWLKGGGMAFIGSMPSVLWCCWLSGRKGIWPVKNWVVGCWHGYLCGARCRLACGPADVTATHCLLLQWNPDWFFLSGTGSPG